MIIPLLFLPYHLIPSTIYLDFIYIHPNFTLVHSIRDLTYLSLIVPHLMHFRECNQFDC
jgi:hypothetical protein